MNAATDKPLHEGYDSFYQSGGWRYDLTEEALFLPFRVLQPLVVTGAEENSIISNK